MSALSELLKSRQGDRSVRQIGRECTKYGIGETTVIPYFNGKHGANPPEEVLYALSMVMPIDIGELREVAGVPRGESEPYVAPLEANRLSHRQRIALDELIRSFTSEGAQGASSSNPSAAARTPGKAGEAEEADALRQSDYDLAGDRDVGQSEGRRLYEESRKRGEDSQVDPHDE